MTLFDRLRNANENGEGVALATVVSGTAGIGQKMLVFSDGSSEGDLASRSLRELVAGDAKDMLAAERTDIAKYETDDGQFEVFIESFPERAKLLIVGAGHVAEALSRLGKMMGYEVIVTDARGAFASPERFPEADKVLKGWPQDVLPNIKLS